MVSNVFTNTKIIDIIANHYEPTTQTLRKMHGMPLLVIKKSCIDELFGLSTQALKNIDSENFRNEYQRKMKFGRYRKITHFMYWAIVTE